MIVSTFVSLLVILVAPADPLQSVNQTCQATVDGAAFPFLVPSHVVWNQLWQRADEADGVTAKKDALSRDLGVEKAVAERIVLAAIGRRGVAARQRAMGVSAPLSDAQASLETRDRLLQALDSQGARRVNDWILSKAANTYPLGIAGVIVHTNNGAFACKAQVVGVEHPELIPEWDAWRSYFEFMSASAMSFWLADEGAFQPAFLRALEGRYRGAETDELIGLLGLVVETANSIQALDASTTQLNGRERQEEIRQLTMKARMRLRSQVQVTTWTSVMAEVTQIRKGTVFDFPPVEETKSSDEEARDRRIHVVRRRHRGSDGRRGGAVRCRLLGLSVNLGHPSWPLVPPTLRADDFGPRGDAQRLFWPIHRKG